MSVPSNSKENEKGFKNALAEAFNKQAHEKTLVKKEGFELFTFELSNLPIFKTNSKENLTQLAQGIFQNAVNNYDKKQQIEVSIQKKNPTTMTIKLKVPSDYRAAIWQTNNLKILQNDLHKKMLEIFLKSSKKAKTEEILDKEHTWIVNIHFHEFKKIKNFDKLNVAELKNILNTFSDKLTEMVGLKNNETSKIHIRINSNKEQVSIEMPSEYIGRIRINEKKHLVNEKKQLAQIQAEKERLMKLQKKLKKQVTQVVSFEKDIKKASPFEEQLKKEISNIFTQATLAYRQDIDAYAKFQIKFMPKAMGSKVEDHTKLKLFEEQIFQKLIQLGFKQEEIKKLGLKARLQKNELIIELPSEISDAVEQKLIKEARQIFEQAIRGHVDNYLMSSLELFNQFADSASAQSTSMQSKNLKHDTEFSNIQNQTFKILFPLNDNTVSALGKEASKLLTPVEQVDIIKWMILRERLPELGMVSENIDWHSVKIKIVQNQNFVEMEFPANFSRTFAEKSKQMSKKSKDDKKTDTESAHKPTSPKN